jgi:hypothetical protein
MNFMQGDQPHKESISPWLAGKNFFVISVCLAIISDY